MISIEDFKKIEVKIGEVTAAEKVEGADKLLKLIVDFGEGTPRQVVSGIALHIAPEQLVGKKFPFAVNLEPRTIRGLESQAMILAASLAPQSTHLFPRP
jgi:methionyl-tRNA synthetase